MKLLQLCRNVKMYYRQVIAPADSEKSVGGDKKIPIGQRIKYNLLGFSAKEVDYYDLLHNDYRKNISA